MLRHVGSPGFERPVRRKRRLRRIGMLPTLLTLGNLCFGLGAIHMCSRELEYLGELRQPGEQGYADPGDAKAPRYILTWDSKTLEHLAPSYLSIGCWMLIAAMICDGLDGRVARKTGQESKFGEQLDSLADVVSCGVAPALMMITMVRRELTQWGAALRLRKVRPTHRADRHHLRLLRGPALARFNVEATLEQASHEGFKGLPSPGAAGGVISLVFIHDHLDHEEAWWGWVTTANWLTVLLPLCTLGVALLMVSRVKYSHAFNLLLRRRPFAHIIPVLLLVPLSLLYPKQVLTIAAWLFILAGAVKHLYRRASGTVPAPAAAAPGTTHDPTPASHSPHE